MRGRAPGQQTEGCEHQLISALQNTVKVVEEVLKEHADALEKDEALMLLSEPLATTRRRCVCGMMSHSGSCRLVTRLAQRTASKLSHKLTLLNHTLALVGRWGHLNL